MKFLHDPWPLALGRRSWPVHVGVLLLLLAAILTFDASLSRWAQAWPDGLRAVFAAVTHYGLSDWVLIPSLALALLCAALSYARRGRLARLAMVQLTQLWSFVFVGVAFPGLVTAVAKRILGRGRPELLDTMGPLSFQRFFNDHTFQSFPSGHTTTSFAIAFTLGFLWPRSFVTLLVVAILVAVSRVVVGAHFPTDVAAGAVVGALLTYLVRNAFAARRWLFERATDGSVRRRPLLAVRRWLTRFRVPRGSV